MRISGMFITIPTRGVSGRMCSSGSMMVLPAGGAHQSSPPLALEISLAVTPNHRPTSSSVSPFFIWYVIRLPTILSLPRGQRERIERPLLEFVFGPRAIRGWNRDQRDEEEGGEESNRSIDEAFHELPGFTDRFAQIIDRKHGVRMKLYRRD